MLTYASLKDNPATFLCATGLTVSEFQAVLPVFTRRYQASQTQHTWEGKPRQRAVGGGVKGQLATAEDKLLFILVYLKTYPLQTMQGVHFDLGQSRTNDWIQRLLPILQQALAELGLTPVRDASLLAGSEATQAAPADWGLDGTERRRQRPHESDTQRAHYSGKKKTHTDKNIFMVNLALHQVSYLSATAAGKVHDKKVADTSALTYPRAATVGQDTGFQGYAPAGVLTWQPKKKPKGRELDAVERFLNRLFSGVRIQVEHVLAGVKRCRVVKDVLRNTTEGFSDCVMEVACALHNLRVRFRQPQATLNLFELVT